MSTTEEQVTSTPTGAAAFAAAKASAGQSDLSDQATVSDDTPETSTVEEPVVADQPEESTEETDALLTAEELAFLPSKERAKAEKWQAKLTRAAQEQSAARKQIDKWKTLTDLLETNPDEAIKQLAKQRGLKLAEEPVKDNTS